MVEFHINTDLEKLNKGVKERLHYLEERRMEQEQEEAVRLKLAKKILLFTKRMIII